MVSVEKNSRDSFGQNLILVYPAYRHLALHTHISAGRSVGPPAFLVLGRSRAHELPPGSAAAHSRATVVSLNTGPALPSPHTTLLLFPPPPTPNRYFLFAYLIDQGRHVCVQGMRTTVRVVCRSKERAPSSASRHTQRHIPLLKLPHNWRKQRKEAARPRDDFATAFLLFSLSRVCGSSGWKCKKEESILL